MGSSPIRVATPTDCSQSVGTYASVAQLVEQGTENPRVVGSIPTGGTISPSFHMKTHPAFSYERTHTRDVQKSRPYRYADLAHLVERDLAKVEVAGSSPVIRSKQNKR